MFANGRTPGYGVKEKALEIFPKGTACLKKTAMGITGYVVYLPNAMIGIASASTSLGAWEKALDWAERNASALGKLNSAKGMKDAEASTGDPSVRKKKRASP